ncbi:MAG: ATP-binding protein [Acidobacteriota bacterium]
MSFWRGLRAAPRSDFQVLLPGALLLLVLLSTYALLAYRGAVHLLLEERRVEARQLARSLTSELMSARSLPGEDALRRRLPQAANVAILDPDGDLRVGVASPGSPSLRRDPEAESTSGPVAGIARFKRGEQTLAVRVELPATLLRSRQQGLGILTPVMLTVNGTITLLLLFSLRRFLAPFDRLVERARDAGQEVPESQDEVVFLIETFEKALEVLAEPAVGSSDFDDLKALERTLAKSLESGVLLLDARGAVLALNDLGRALLELPPIHVGAPLATVLGDHHQLVEALERAIRQQQSVQRVECAIQSSSGERTLGVTAHPLRRDDAILRGILVMFTDLTQVKQEIEEQQLADSLAQLGELTAGIAHELRNSVATLRGYLTLIDRSPDQESIRDYLGEIGRESDHLHRVLEDFLTFARPGSARLDDVDLLKLLHRAAADPSLGQGTVPTVTVQAEAVQAASADTAALDVRGDPQLLERALRNVLSNAVEASQRAGAAEPVVARIESREGGVEIRIEDRGEGLSAAAKDKLFDPFFTERSGGVGLGLALTRRIVLLHAGRIALENRSGGGTRATLWIPRGKSVTKGNESPLRTDPSMG